MAPFIVLIAKKLSINLFMKIKILIPIIVLSLVLISQPAFAKSGPSATATANNQIRQEVQEKKQEVKTALSEVKQEKIQSVYQAIKNGLTKRHDALLKIKDKIQARIDKNPMNKNTTAAKAELAKFAAAESKYQTDLTALDAKFTELKSSTKPSEVIKGLKDAVKLVREDLNAIKKVLTSTVVALAQAPKLEVTKTK